MFSTTIESIEPRLGREFILTSAVLNFSLGPGSTKTLAAANLSPTSSSLFLQTRERTV